MDGALRLSDLVTVNDQKIVLLVLDGLGDIRTVAQPKTALEQARTPVLDDLCQRSALGSLVAAGTGVTPGSGPGHLGLFGYDPTLERFDIGRGVLEALGLGLVLGPRCIAARGNFATVDEDGLLIDRRAGRIPSSEGERLCEKLRRHLEQIDTGGVEITIAAGEGYRFVLLFEGDDLCAQLADTDPQQLSVPVKRLDGESDEARACARRLQPILDQLQTALADELRGNSFLLRGFSKMPHLPSFDQLYQLRAGAFAGYPLYRGVASACGMEVIETSGQRFGHLLDSVEERWSDFDFLFIHVKQTDQAGEDGDIDAKVAVIEEVDGALPRLLNLGPDVLAITGDHSTPAPMKAHSWHPIPLLLCGPLCGIDDSQRFTELEVANRGAIGRLPSKDLMALLLANASKLTKYGA